MLQRLPAVVLLVCGLIASRFGTVAVVTGASMHPTLRVGDACVVARTAEVVKGDIVLFRPAGARKPVLHRVEAIAPDGAVRTKGDANAIPDREPTPPEAVLGVVKVVVPTGRLFEVASP